MEKVSHGQTRTARDGGPRASNMVADSDTELIDLMHLGRDRVIGAWRVGDVIVDPGPSSCLATLLDALEGRTPRALALTHIHLDHAGAAGSLVARFPDLEVWVHERGAPHIIDPTRLLASATRLYGDDMQRLWGEMLPVPAERVRVLQGGELMGPFRVAYTPGHASHHVSYLHEGTRRAFTGDVTGVRIADGIVLAPTPPPEVDLSAWRSSLDLVDSWAPDTLAITHFGQHEDVSEHLAAMRAALQESEDMARDLDQSAFVTAFGARIAGSVANPDTAASYEQAVPPKQSFQGLLRYLRGAERGSPR